MNKPFAYGSIDPDRQAIYSRLTLFETEICDNWATHFDALIFYYFFFLDGWAWLITRLLINDRDYVFTEQTEAQPTHKLMLPSSPEGQGGEGTCALSTRLTLCHGIR